jgi:hypothetical protein
MAIDMQQRFRFYATPFPRSGGIGVERTRSIFGPRL